MAIKISDVQSEKVNGISINQIYVSEMRLFRSPDGSNAPFVCDIKFSMSMKTDEGKYAVTRKERTIRVNDMGELALARAMNGNYEIAQADAALQLAIADIIRTNCADLTSAEVV